MLNEGTPGQYDILVDGSTGQLKLKFLIGSPNSGSELEKFNKREWFSLKEFPTLVELNRFLEKHFDKPQDWFLTNYIPTTMDALDRISLALEGKIFSEAFGQKKANEFGMHVFFWLLYLAKELKQTRLPCIFSYLEPTKVN